VLDNATLAAAEIIPSLHERTVRFILLGLLISGGMLIPGNIPNIISASKLSIRSREWAAAAVPIGLVMMTAYFLILLIV
jgi:predicted cation transporter